MTTNQLKGFMEYWAKVYSAAASNLNNVCAQNESDEVVTHAKGLADSAYRQYLLSLEAWQASL